MLGHSVRSAQGPSTAEQGSIKPLCLFLIRASRLRLKITVTVKRSKLNIMEAKYSAKVLVLVVIKLNKGHYYCCCCCTVVPA